MDLGLKDRVALVTGASKGLGRAVAQALAAEGAKVCICSRDEAAIRQAAAAIAAATGAQVVPVAADVSTAAGVQRAVAAAQEAFGRIDILVSNSGGPRPGAFLELDDDAWYGAVDLLLMSAVRLARAVLPGMVERRWGRVLFVTSGSVKSPIPNLVLSNSIRAAVAGLAKTLANEVTRHGVTVNCLAPGRIDTDRVRSLDEDTARRTGQSLAEVQAHWQRTIPAGRYGTPEEFGRAAAFLCSEAASYISGVYLMVDGGQVNTLL